MKPISTNWCCGACGIGAQVHASLASDMPHSLSTSPLLFFPINSASACRCKRSQTSWAEVSPLRLAEPQPRWNTVHKSPRALGPMILCRWIKYVLYRMHTTSRRCPVEPDSDIEKVYELVFLESSINGVTVGSSFGISSLNFQHEDTQRQNQGAWCYLPWKGLANVVGDLCLPMSGDCKAG